MVLPRLVHPLAAVPERLVAVVSNMEIEQDLEYFANTIRTDAPTPANRKYAGNQPVCSTSSLVILACPPLPRSPVVFVYPVRGRNSITRYIAYEPTHTYEGTTLQRPGRSDSASGGKASGFKGRASKMFGRIRNRGDSCKFFFWRGFSSHFLVLCVKRGVCCRVFLAAFFLLMFVFFVL